MNDLQCAKLGRKYAAALPCRTKTKQNNATQEPQVKAHLNSNQSKLLGKTKSRPLAGQHCLLCQAPAQGQNPISTIQQSRCSHPSTKGAVLILQQYVLSLLHTKNLKSKKKKTTKKNTQKKNQKHQTYSMSSLATYRFPSCLTPSALWLASSMQEIFITQPPHATFPGSNGLIAYFSLPASLVAPFHNPPAPPYLWSTSADLG